MVDATVALFITDPLAPYPLLLAEPLIGIMTSIAYLDPPYPVV